MLIIPVHSKSDYAVPSHILIIPSMLSTVLQFNTSDTHIILLSFVYDCHKPILGNINEY